MRHLGVSLRHSSHRISSGTSATRSSAASTRHKYGLAYAGVGYLVLRDKSFLPDEIVFTVNYLGSPQISFTLNFSKSGVQVIGSYYQFLRLGKNGYRAIMSNLIETSDYLAKTVKEIDGGRRFQLMSETNGRGLPLVAWQLKDGAAKWDEFALARLLRQRGWIVPAYTMAPHCESIKLLRVVVREDFSRSRCEAFVRDLKAAIKTLDDTPDQVLEHNKKESEKPDSSHHTRHQNKTHIKHQEKHSLQGKHGKTHAVC